MIAGVLIAGLWLGYLFGQPGESTATRRESPTGQTLSRGAVAGTPTASVARARSSRAETAPSSDDRHVDQESADPSRLPVWDEGAARQARFASAVRPTRQLLQRVSIAALVRAHAPATPAAERAARNFARQPGEIAPLAPRAPPLA